MHKGKLITFEGGEGSGKSTQLFRLQSWLKSSGWAEKIERFIITREPGGTPKGQKLRQFLLEQTESLADDLDPKAELLVYLADRAHHVAKVVKPALELGTLVLCDRFTDSTVAYQGYARGLGVDFVESLNLFATGGVQPNLTIFLDVDPEEGLRRSLSRNRGLDRIESEKIEFHEKIRSGFFLQACNNPHRIVRVNADGSEDAVFAAVVDAVVDRLSRWYR
jgi:dTMP kinase